MDSSKIDYTYITFDDFKKFAKDEELSDHQKIGFPDSYREGTEDAIVDDIKSKLTKLDKENQLVIDIGCGCSPVVKKIIDDCGDKNHDLVLADCEEMLDLLPSPDHVKKIPGRFPDNFDQFQEYRGKADVVIIYSVISIVFLEDSIYRFLDHAVELLNDGGQLLIGDIPNLSKRDRFFASPAGIEFHKKFMQTNEPPEVDLLKVKHTKIDDGVVMGILQRYRNSGFEVYLMPQGDEVPMSNRREDILIIKR